MKYLENELGYFYQNSKCLVFFGKALGTLEKIEKLYPKFKFQRVKQTHSDIIVESSDKLVEADAHWTGEKNQALLISTADCIPMMIHCKKTDRIVAIHAGWRGIVHRIASKAVVSLLETGSGKNDFEFWIGPHILKNSFEINEDVFVQLQDSQIGLEDVDFFSQLQDKFYVDLKNTVVSQLEYSLNAKINLHFSPFDTKVDHNFHSFRRGKLTGERNLSFIVLLE